MKKMQHGTGTTFFNDFSLKIEIQRKFQFVLTQSILLKCSTKPLLR